MKAKSAILLVTAYLVVYTVLFQLGISLTLLVLMFLLAPVIILWMVYSVLTDTSQEYPELKEGEEWGYLDKARKELKMF